MVSGKIRTGVNEIWIDEEGVLILRITKDGEVTLDEVKKCFEVYSELGVNSQNKVFQIIDARIYATMNSDARAFAAKVGKDYFKASAVVSDSLAIKLLVNFFNAFYKQEVPFKMFGDEESARKWLRTFN